MVPSKFEVIPTWAQIPLIPLPPPLDSQINNKPRYLAIHPLLFFIHCKFYYIDIFFIPKLQKFCFQENIPSKSLTVVSCKKELCNQVSLKTEDLSVENMYIKMIMPLLINTKI